jgi:CAAX prenyl protease-like protein
VAATDQLPSILPSNTAPILGRFHPRGLLFRILFLAFLFASELLVISISLDGSSLVQARGLAGVIRDGGPSVLRALVGVCALFATFLWLKHRAALERFSLEWEEVPIARGLLCFHAISMATFGWLSSRLYAPKLYQAATFALGSSGVNVLAAGWILAGSAGIVFGALAFLPWKHWRKLLATGGRLWLYASIAILAAGVTGNVSRHLWQPASRLTFAMVRILLKPLVAGVFTNPARMQLGTARFHVIVAPECSGLEGAGLILAFAVVWLLLFHRECRFPQSLVLVPAGVVVLFLLNAVRLAALILIGNAGAERIALGGFHSQAGWILFNAVAAGFCVTIRSVSWFTNAGFTNAGFANDEFTNAGSIGAASIQGGFSTETGRIAEHPVQSAGAENPTAAYLVPFLALVAAGMTATAVSAGFEWLYPLRMVAAAGALWLFRKRYAALTWQVSWIGIASGVLVFLAWIAFDRFFGGSGREDGAPAALLAASPVVRHMWIAVRVLAAVTTVPLVEELAFRGYLMRRFMSADFELVSPQRATWFALGVSSVLFGLLHGGLWIAGIFAGLVFGLVWKWRGSMGEAVVAHASANALLAAYVLLYGQWHLW